MTALAEATWGGRPFGRCRLRGFVSTLHRWLSAVRDTHAPPDTAVVTRARSQPKPSAHSPVPRDCDTA